MDQGALAQGKLSIKISIFNIQMGYQLGTQKYNHTRLRISREKSKYHAGT